MILEQSEELQVGAYFSEGRYVSYFGGKMAISVGIPTRQTCTSICRFDLSRNTVATISLSPFSLFPLSGLILLISPPWHVQPCGDAALDAPLIRLSGERPFGWIYVPHFLCIINSVLWGKEQNVMARPPQRNVPISEEEFYGGGGRQLTASHYTGHIFFFCTTASPLMINEECLIAGSVVWQLQFWPEGRGRP